jgi:hypothetical protein
MFLKIKEPYTPPHIFTAKNLASEHLSALNTTTSYSKSSGGSATPPPGRASYLKALLPGRPPILGGVYDSLIFRTWGIWFFYP